MPQAEIFINKEVVPSAVRGELREQILDFICLDVLGQYGIYNAEPRLIKEYIDRPGATVAGTDNQTREEWVVPYNEFLRIAIRRWPRYLSWGTAWRVFNEVCDREGWQHKTVWLKHKVGWRKTRVAILWLN